MAMRRHFQLLPSEITADILSRVVADSVLNCKLVCKTWLSHINHPSFVDAHTRHVFLDDSAFMGFFICTYFSGRVGEFKLHFGEYNDNDEVEVIPFKLSEPITKHPYPLAPNNMDKTFDLVDVSSCNGLIFAGSMLNIFNDMLYIYNPFTREYVDLVHSFATDSISYKIDEKYYIKNGFGYNHSTNEYKIVRICRSQMFGGLGHACVYTLGSGKWRNKGEIPHSLWNRDPGVFANGAIYWLERHGKMGYYKWIVSFDLDDEEFKIIPLPSPSPETSDNKLGVLRGCLCVISTNYGEISSDIWIANNKECSSWTRKFKVPGKCGLLQSELVGISKGGKILLHNYDDGCLFSYDTKTESFSEIENAPALKKFHMIPYTKSFVSLKGLGEKDAYKL